MSDDNKKRKPGRPPGSKNKAALVRVDKVVAVAAAQVSELKAERKLYTLGKDRLAEIDELMMRYALAYAPAEKDEKGNPCRPFWESPADEARFLQREQGLSSHVFMSERDGPMTPKAFHALFGRIGARAKMRFPIHPHMLRHGCGYALANAGHDTRALQAWLGHKNIQHTVRYTELAPDRFRDFWR